MFGKRYRRKKEQGQAIVEFALTMTLFLMFLLAVVDLGRAWFTVVAVQNAAGEGSLYGMSNTICVVTPENCSAPDSIEWRIQNESNSRLVDPAKMQYTAVCTDKDGNPSNCEPGDMLTVEVTYDYEVILPALSAFGVDVIPIRRTSIQLIP